MKIRNSCTIVFPLMQKIDGGEGGVDEEEEGGESGSDAVVDE